MHFAVLVIGYDIEKQLAPFQENNMGDLPDEMLKFCYDYKWYDTEQEVIEKLGKDFDSDEGYWENPKAKWDWWQIGGRFGGHFKDKKGRLLNKIIKEDIDFEGIYKEVEEKAIKSYQEIHEEVIQGEDFIGWDEFLKDDSLSIDQIMENYHGQSVLKRAKEFAKKKEIFFGLNLESYKVSQEEFIKSKKDSRLQTFAILKDGVWIDKDDFKGDYEKEFKKIFDSIDFLEELTVVDCHI